MKILRIMILAAGCLMMQMCSTKVPENATAIDQQPKIEPDYTDLDIPVNIAPLNFSISEKGDDYVTLYHTKSGKEMVVRGKVLDIDVDKWHELTDAAQGDTLYATVYVSKDGQWSRFAPIKYYVAEAIDPYISYRHIEPLYMTYDVLNICQRNLENFDVEDIYNNCPYLDVEGDRQCMNCHSYQDYNRGGNMQMHIRVKHPGTLIVKDGEVKKVNLKVGKAFSAGAYPSWHPTLPLIAYSINDTWQHFHSVNTNKVEVQDAQSDLILYDTENNTVQMIAETSTELETFPWWSSDGKYLYYVSATVPEMTKEEMANYRINNFRDFKYNIYRKPFDAESGTFGATDTVFMASDIGKSATFARESPDGRYVMFTMGEYGTFHNFHHDADLYIIDNATGEVRAADAMNSDDTESYHNWSSNGRWVIFSSRRDNGSYTRLYISHFDNDGNPHKAFVLPQRSPHANDMKFKSYNVPEFMVRPVEVTRQQWLDAIEHEAADARFKE